MFSRSIGNFAGALRRSLSLFKPHERQACLRYCPNLQNGLERGTSRSSGAEALYDKGPPASPAQKEIHMLKHTAHAPDVGAQISLTTTAAQQMVAFQAKVQMNGMTQARDVGQSGAL